MSAPGFLIILHCRWHGGSVTATCCKQSIKEVQHHLWDMLPAASSTDSCLPGSLNVWDLSVSISQLISQVHHAAVAAAHSSCCSVSTCSHYPKQDTQWQWSRGGIGNASVEADVVAWGSSTWYTAYIWYTMYPNFMYHSKSLLSVNSAKFRSSHRNDNIWNQIMMMEFGVLFTCASKLLWWSILNNEFS